MAYIILVESLKIEHKPVDFKYCNFCHNSDTGLYLIMYSNTLW